MSYAVIRVRGQPDVNRDVEYTMGLLGDTRVNHCVVVPEDDSTKGMLQKVKDYCTWGEINQETLVALIRTRGKLTGDKDLTEDHLKEVSEFKTYEDLSKAIIEDSYRLRDIESAKPVFRLHPPIKGYEGNIRSYKTGGALGYRGEAIIDLNSRML